jgi:hypothetical protein
MYKSPGSDQIPSELIQVGDEILRSEIHKKKTPWFLVRKRTIPTERPQPAGDP